jgi:hypothetical protein
MYVMAISHFLNIYFLSLFSKELPNIIHLIRLCAFKGVGNRHCPYGGYLIPDYAKLSHSNIGVKY